MKILFIDVKKAHLNGKVKDGEPYLTKLGDFELDVNLSGGCLVLCRQSDQPGVIGKVGTQLAAADINVSFMTVGRTGPREDAMMVIGVDEKPTQETAAAVSAIDAIKESVLVDLPMTFF